MSPSPGGASASGSTLLSPSARADLPPLLAHGLAQGLAAMGNVTSTLAHVAAVATGGEVAPPTAGSVAGLAPPAAHGGGMTVSVLTYLRLFLLDRVALLASGSTAEAFPLAPNEDALRFLKDTPPRAFVAFLASAQW